MSKSYSKIWVHAVWSTKNRIAIVFNLNDDDYLISNNEKSLKRL